MENNNISDAAAARRRALAEAIKQGNNVVVTPTGAVEFKEEAEAEGLSNIVPPDGKLARED